MTIMAEKELRQILRFANDQALYRVKSFGVNAKRERERDDKHNI